MKILFWNIGYAPGLDGSLKDYTLRGHRLLHLSRQQQQSVLDQIAAVVSEAAPDIALYAEISLGSQRNQRFNQHEYMLSKLTGVVAEGATPKYRHELLARMPLHAGNANGFVSWREATVHEVHFSVGKKTLVYVIKMEEISIVMVHLSLERKRRKLQLQELAVLVNALKGPVVVCGDMNIFGGLEELKDLQSLTGLELPADVPFTYPAFNPKLPLDLCLVRDCGSVKISTIASTVSDHAPILIDLA